MGPIPPESYPLFNRDGIDIASHRLRCLHFFKAGSTTMAVTQSRRIDFPQVDMAGIVYYPEYWDMCHRFFEGSWPQIAQIDYPTLIGERKIGFPAVDNKATFHAPLRYGDVVECRLWISKIGNTSLEWQYRYFNQGGDLVWSASVMTVCVDMESLKPMVIPEDLRAGLAATTADGEVE